MKTLETTAGPEPYLPYSANDISVVKRRDIPRQVWRVLDLEARQFISPDTTPDYQFDSLMTLHHDNEQITYFAGHDKTYPANDRTERLIYAVDTDESGHIIGNGEVRLALTDTRSYFLNKPFVGNTITAEGYRRQGLGRRRLLAMNAASLFVHSLVLHSDTLRRPEASSIWRKLVKDGLAESYFEPGVNPELPANSRFKFI